MSERMALPLFAATTGMHQHRKMRAGIIRQRKPGDGLHVAPLEAHVLKGSVVEVPQTRNRIPVPQICPDAADHCGKALRDADEQTRPVRRRVMKTRHGDGFRSEVAGHPPGTRHHLWPPTIDHSNE